MKQETTVGTAGPLPLKMDCGRNPDMFVIVTNQGNHYATTYDPAAARLIVAGPELLIAARNAMLALLALDGEKEYPVFTATLHAAILRAEGK